MCGVVIDVEFLGFVKKVAEQATLDVIRMMNLASENRTGAGFVMYRYFKPLSDPIILGEIINGKEEVYKEFAGEKCHRLATMHRDKGHELSSQSRDPKQKMWGGGVLLPGEDCSYYIAISGLPEMCDEAAMLITTVRLGMRTVEDATRLAHISNNEVFLDHLEEWF